MQEKTLLMTALITAIVGLIILFFMPQTPPEELRGEVAWSNGTLTRLVITEDVWVEHEQEITLLEGSCVLLSARASFSGYTNARLLGVHQSGSGHCQ